MWRVAARDRHRLLLGYRGPVRNDERGRLRADCANCFGLCCVALQLRRSADFAIDKPAGSPCPNLAADFSCGIHRQLRTKGFRGCSVYDCFGAGQHLSQHTFGGRDWRSEPETASAMFDLLPVMRALHEFQLYLIEALAHPATIGLRAELSRALADLRTVADGDAARLATVDVDAQRDIVNPLLLAASELARARYARRAEHRGADLIGAKLAGRNLSGANLRGAYLIGADLRRANLRGADLIGADLRDTDLRGADLTDALFLTQPQLEAATGDHATTLPRHTRHPDHW